MATKATFRSTTFEVSDETLTPEEVRDQWAEQDPSIANATYRVVDEETGDRVFVFTEATSTKG